MRYSGRADGGVSLAAVARACGTLAPLALAAAAGGLLLSGCAPSPDAATAQASSAAQRDRTSGMTVRRDIALRFPGATILGEAEFGRTIVGRAFSYREVGSELLLQRPNEVFAEGGQYRIHWSRSISYGTYSVEHGIVSIDCGDCPYNFLNLGWTRIFFRHAGRLLMTTADGERSVVELILEP